MLTHPILFSVAKAYIWEKTLPKSQVNFLSQTDRFKNACYFLIEDDIISVLIAFIFVMISICQNRSVVLGYPHILSNTEKLHFNHTSFFKNVEGKLSHIGMNYRTYFIEIWKHLAVTLTWHHNSQVTQTMFFKVQIIFYHIFVEHLCMTEMSWIKKIKRNWNSMIILHSFMR